MTVTKEQLVSMFETCKEENESIVAAQQTFALKAGIQGATTTQVKEVCGFGATEETTEKEVANLSQRFNTQIMQPLKSYILQEYAKKEESAANLTVGDIWGNGASETNKKIREELNKFLPKRSGGRKAQPVNTSHLEGLVNFDV